MSPNTITGRTVGRLKLIGTVTSRSLIVGVGNVDRGDDGFGPAVVDSLRRHVPGRVLDAGTTPESYAHLLACSGADNVLLIDAVAMGRRPGHLELLDPDGLSGGLETHAGGLWLLTDYLRHAAGMHCRVLGAEPLRTERWPAGHHGIRSGTNGLSPPLRRAARRATRLILLALSRQPDWRGVFPCTTGSRS